MGGLRAVRKRHVWLLAPFVALISPLSRPLGDNSFLWHVRAGTMQLDAGEVLRTDPFSYTASGEAWRTQSWLAELGYGFLEKTIGGVGWSRLLVAAALVTTGLLVMRRAERLGGSLPIVVALGLVFVLQTFVFAVPRPVLFSYPLLAAVTLMVDDEEAELWVLVGLMWLWAALHGSFVLGLGVLALDALRRRDVRRWIALGLATAAVSLTAHGIAVWQILIDFARRRETLSVIEEWRAPGITDLRVAPYFLVLGLLVVLAARRRVGWRDLLVAAPFALFGLLAVRNTLPALIVAGPVVAATMGGPVRPMEADPARSEVPLANAVLAGGIAALLVIAAVQPRPFREDRFPSDAVVRELGAGRAFHDDAVGGYLIWATGPERQVYIDDRAELHGIERFRQMRSILDGEADVEVLDALGVEQALVASDAPLVALLEEAGWVVRIDDGNFVLLDRPV